MLCITYTFHVLLLKYVCVLQCALKIRMVIYAVRHVLVKMEPPVIMRLVNVAVQQDGWESTVVTVRNYCRL